MKKSGLGDREIPVFTAQDASKFWEPFLRNPSPAARESSRADVKIDEMRK